MANVDIIDNRMNVIKSVSKEEAHSKSLLHIIVHGIVINKDNKIFLVKRALSQKHGPGLFDASIGGHVDSDENPSDAIVREAKEELGIEISKVKESLIHTIKDGTSNHMVFVYLIKHEGPFKLCTREFSGAEWMKIKDIIKLKEDKATPDLIKTIEKLINSKILFN